MTLDLVALKKSFFGSGNDFRLDDAPEPLASLIEAQFREYAEESDAWLVLPRKRGSTLGWYGLASRPEAERRMREALNAFVGPSYGRMSKSRRTLRSDDPLEDSLKELGVRHVMLIRPREPTSDTDRAVIQLLRTRMRAPGPKHELPRPIGLIMRDFHLALSVFDEEESARLLDELEQSDQIRPENVRYLTLERLGRLSKWDELANHVWFDTMVETRRPRRVSELMLEAIWHTALEPNSHSVEELEAAFLTASLGDRYRPLFNAIETTDNPLAMRTLVLASHVDRDIERLRALLVQVAPDDPDYVALFDVEPAGAILPTRVPTDLEGIRRLFTEGRYELVLDAVDASETDIAAIEFALRSAAMLDDPNYAERTLELAARLPESGQATLHQDPVYGPLVSRVQALARLGCTDWMSWFRKLAEDSWQEASKAAEVGLGRWSGDFLDSQGLTDEASDLLIEAYGDGDRLEVRESLGILARLLSEEATRRSATTLRVAVLLILTHEESPTPSVRNALTDLLIGVLESGPQAREYQEVVAALRDRWEQVRAYEAFNWVVDCADLLGAYATPVRSERDELLKSIVRETARFERRLADHERKLLLELLEESEMVWLAREAEWLEVADTPDLDIWAGLAHRIVGLYSLLEKGANRFRSHLENLNPNVTVELNSDLHGSNRLRALAERADYLLVDTFHAQHSATAVIDGVRPKSEQIFPKGKGVASFLSALRERLEMEQDA